MTEGTNNVLSVLIAERDRLDQAIAVLQGGTAASARMKKYWAQRRKEKAAHKG